MKTLLLQILHYLWVRRENIYSLYIKYKKNGDIKDLTFKDFEDFINVEQGAILDENSISENDFLLGNVDKKSLDDYLKNLKSDKVGIYYNQGKLKRTRNACTLFASAGAISDLTGNKFSENELLEICNIAEKEYGWKENYGGWVYKAVDCVRNYWNDRHSADEQLVSFRINLKTDLGILKKLNNVGKTIVIGYRTTREHYNDSQDNGILDNKCFVSCLAKQTGGHCIRHNKYNNIDNYIGRKKFNTYSNNYLSDLAIEGTYFTHGYVFFYKKDFEKIAPEIVKKSDYDKGLEMGLIEHPTPNRIVNEKLEITILYRAFEKMGLIGKDGKLKKIK